MNIIYIHTHDTGRYISPYGHNIPTPTLMNLAKDGTLFRQAHSAAPTCSPSRASLLTGMLPHNNNMLGLAHRGFSLADPSKHLANFLKENGYKTILSGVQHVARKAEDIGYDEIVTTDKPYDRYTCVCDDGSLWDQENSENAAKAILNENSNKFFLSMGLYSTHRTFPKIDSEINPDYVNVPEGIPDTIENRKDWAAFLTSAKIGDSCIATVIKALKKKGVYEDSLIIYTTDHGIAFPNMKCTLRDSGTGVSLILKFPDNPLRGKVLDSLVSHLDIFPTICDLTGLKPPLWLQGKSLLPLFNDVEEVNDAVYSEVNFHAAYEPMRMVRTKRYKYIRYFNEDYQKAVLSNIDNSPYKEILVNSSWKDFTDKPTEELYDLLYDSREGHNLVKDNRYATVLQEMKVKLKDKMKETQDPLLENQILRPKGSRINTLECIDTKGPYAAD